MRNYDELKKIFNSFGVEPQVKKLMEEVAELVEAIHENDTAHAIEEFTDVQIVLDGLMVGVFQNLPFHVIESRLSTIRQEKINRTLDRIEVGYYKKCAHTVGVGFNYKYCPDCGVSL